MKQDFVLRPTDGTSAEMHFTLRSRNQIQTRDDAAISVSILRRDDNGFITVLFGEKIVSGFVDKHNGSVTLTVDGRPQTFSLQPAALDAMRQGLLHANKHSGPMEIRSPIPGTLKALMVEVGATVEAGQTLAILEAMKMENEIRAPHTGIVEKISAGAGQNVASGALLFTLKV
jgi:biotin carboxyl carrier protein